MRIPWLFYHLDLALALADSFDLLNAVALAEQVHYSCRLFGFYFVFLFLLMHFCDFTVQFVELDASTCASTPHYLLTNICNLVPHYLFKLFLWRWLGRRCLLSPGLLAMKRSTMSHSFTEAEYCALTNTASYIYWLYQSLLLGITDLLQWYDIVHF